ncbi:MAG: helix-turn-helix domain-containing protein [Candidatus Helarchaeota archaeon]|nr:helix-turn-helix domain-containing protein [Candidatus Helarchaeota archaeon]
MAAMRGISQPHLSWWETGKYKPSAGYLRRLNQFLSLDPLALRIYVMGVGLQPRRRKQR